MYIPATLLQPDEIETYKSTYTVWCILWASECTLLYFYKMERVIAVNFIVIAVHATCSTISNIMNGDMFYNLKFQIRLIMLIWFGGGKNWSQHVSAWKENRVLLPPLQLQNRIQWLLILSRGELFNWMFYQYLLRKYYMF